MAVIPKRGEVWILDLDPTMGGEMKKTRPVLVLSTEAYNRLTGLFTVVPITSQVHGTGLEVPIRVRGVAGAVRIDQINTKSWRAREASRLGNCPQETMEDVMARIVAHIGVA